MDWNGIIEWAARRVSKSKGQKNNKNRRDGAHQAKGVEPLFELTPFEQQLFVGGMLLPTGQGFTGAWPAINAPMSRTSAASAGTGSAVSAAAAIVAPVDAAPAKVSAPAKKSSPSPAADTAAPSTNNDDLKNDLSSNDAGAVEADRAMPLGAGSGLKVPAEAALPAKAQKPRTVTSPDDLVLPDAPNSQKDPFRQSAAPKSAPNFSASSSATFASSGPGVVSSQVVNNANDGSVTIFPISKSDTPADWTINGSVVKSGSDFVLTEQSRLITSMQRSITVPAGPAKLQFSYSNLVFDTTDANDGTDAIRDAFEVALIDNDGKSLVPTIGTGREAFFNITEGVTPQTASGSGVTVNGQTILLDLSGLTAGTTANVVFRLVNNDSDTASTVRLLGAEDAPFVASIGGDSAVDEGSSYTLRLGGTGTGSDRISNWTINWGDGQTSNITGQPPSTTHTYVDGANNYTISATATSGAVQSTATQAVTVRNVAPTLAIAGNTTTAPGTSYTLNLASQDPGQDTITRWNINWGDGGAVEQVNGNPSSRAHTYTASGNFTITATATDEDGTFSSNSLNVQSTGTASVSITGPATSNEGSSYTLQLAASGIAAGAIDSWTIDWGDGRSDHITGNPATTPHIYTDGPGTRTISATAFAGSDFYQSAPITVTVANLNPMAVLTGGSVESGTPITVGFSGGTDPSSDDIAAGLRYSIALSTAALVSTYASASTSTSSQFTFNTTGAQTVYGRVFDKDGGFTDYSSTVNVFANAPVVTVQNIAGTEGTAVNLSASFTDQDVSDTHTATIDWGDGTASTTGVVVEANGSGSVTGSHTYNDNGAYTVTVSVTDNTAQSSNGIATATISNVAPTATLSNDGPKAEGGTVRASFSAPSDPSSADVAAGLRYSFATSAAALAGTYAAASTAAFGDFTFNDNGTYTIYGRIIDKNGGFTDYTTTATVTNVAPTASLTNNGPKTVGQPVRATFSLPNDPSSADITAGLHYSFATTAGSLASTYAAASTATFADFTFPTNGVKTIYGRVFDKDGGFTDYTTSVTINASAPVVTVAAISGNEGATVNLSASFTDSDSTDTHTATINWGDGTAVVNGVVTESNGNGSVAGSHVYADNGAYTVTVTVTDSGTLVGSNTATATIANVAPTATITNNGPKAEGSPVRVSLTSPVDPSTVDAASLRYSFATSIAGLAANYSAASTTAFSDFTFNDNNSYTVYARIYDKDGGVSTNYSTVVVITNANPTATISTTGSLNEGSPITVQLTGATDPSSVDAASLHYSFATTQAGLLAGYAASGTVNSANFTYPDNGPQTLWGRVIDKDGGFTDYSINFTVGNVAPTSTLTNNGPVTTGATVRASFGAASDPSTPDTNATFHYSIATSSAALATTYASAGTSSFADFTFPTSGSKTIYGRIFDKDGGFTDYTTTVTVTANAPVVTAGNISGVEGQQVNLSASFTDADPVGTHTATINWGDGTAVTNGVVTESNGNGTVAGTHTYADNGSYTVTVTVTDSSTLAGSKSVTATISNAIPSATIANNGPVNEGTPVQVSFTGGTDPSTVDATSLHYSFALTSAALAANYAAASTTTTANFTFNDNGTYTVFGRVYDKDGGTHDYQTSVIVNNVAPTATFSNNGPVAKGENVTISFTSVADVAPDVSAGFTYKFDLNNDGVYEISGTSPTTTTSFQTLGNAIVKGRIIDKDAGQRDFTTTVHVTNDVIRAPNPAAPLTFEYTYRSAANHNELGIFVVDDEDGRINGMLPGASGYWRAALNRALDPTRQTGAIAFPQTLTEPALPRTYTVTLPAGALFSYYMVSNDTTANAVSTTKNPIKSPDDSPTSPGVFFSFPNAVSSAAQGGFGHFIRTKLTDGRTQYEVEDATSTTTKDYNDMIFTVYQSRPATAGQTKFIVVDNKSVEGTVSLLTQYDSGGAFVKNGSLTTAPTTPSGIASNTAGTKQWVIDRSTKKVYVVSATSGTNKDATFGASVNWPAAPPTTGAFNRPEGIAVSGSALWIADAQATAVAGKLYRFNTGATQTGTTTTIRANTTFTLNAANVSPSDIVTSGVASPSTATPDTLYVTDDSADKVFVYTFNGTALTFVRSWSLAPANSDASGVALDPAISTAGDLWVVDRVDKSVYHYATGRTTTAASLSASDVVNLNYADTQGIPEGIADPTAPEITTNGTDFWGAVPNHNGDARAVVQVTGGAQAASGTLQVPGLSYSVNYTVAAGQTVFLELPSTTQTSASAEATENISFHVTASTPVSVVLSPYQITNDEGRLDSYTLLPTASLGSDYYALAYPATANSGAQSYFLISATVDNTSIQITPTAATGSRAANTTYTIVLNRGQVYHLIDSGPVNDDLSGSHIVSTNPIAVTSGTIAQLGNEQVPGRGGAEIEQLLPVQSWGQHFFTAPIAYSNAQQAGSTDPFTIVAQQNSTTVTINSPGGASQNFVLQQGQKAVRFISGGAEISSSAPIEVAQWGRTDVGSNKYPGNFIAPFMMLVPPDSQYLNSYRINLLGGNEVWLPGYVNIVIPVNAESSLRIDNAPVSATFLPVGQNSAWAAAQISTPPGQHTITASQPFGAWYYVADVDDSPPYGGSTGTFAGLYMPPVASNTIALTPSLASRATGLPQTFTATVRDGSNLPMSNQTVTFTVTGANPRTVTATTDVRGIARLTYSGSTAGVDTVTGTTGPAQATATLTWLTTASPTISIVSPTNGSSFLKGTPVLLSGLATAGGPTAPISYVTINGTPVDGLDATGQFFAQIKLALGSNVFTVVATDALGRTATTTITLTGLAAGVPNIGQTSDHTSDFAPQYARTSFDTQTNTLYTDLAIRNTSLADLRGPFVVVIDQISDASVTAHAPDGYTFDGKPYFNFGSAVADGVLSPSETSLFKTIAFDTLQQKRFTYKLRVLTGDNAPPRFTSAPRVDAAANQIYKYDADAIDPDGDTIAYSLVSAPTDLGFSISSTTGVMNWEPPVTGQFTVTVRADDGHGAHTDQTFEISVAPSQPNRPPFFVTPPLVTASVNRVYTYSFVGDDPDDDPLSFAVTPGTSLPSWLTLNLNGNTLSGTPTTFGDYPISLRISDLSGAWSDQTFTLRVQPNPDRHAPLIITKPTTTVASPNQVFRYDVDAVDEDLPGDSLTYSLLTPFQNLTINSTTGLLTWTAPPAGTQTLTIKVADTDGYVDLQTFALDVKPAGSPLGAIEGTVFGDDDLDGLHELTENGVAGWTVFLDQNGNRNLDSTEPSTITASNGSYSFGSLVPGNYLVAAVRQNGKVITAPLVGEVSLTVQPGISRTNADFGVANAATGANQNPVFKSAAPTDATDGDLLLYRSYATDSDGDPITYSLDQHPAGMTVDPQDGIVAWRPTASQAGINHTVILRANDGRGGTITQTFVIAVAASGNVSTPGNQPPVFVSLPVTSATVGEKYTYAIRAIDPDGDALTYSLIQQPAGMAFVPGTSILQWTPDDNVNQQVVVRVTDARGGSQTQSFTISVAGQPADHVPVITSKPNSSAKTDLNNFPYLYQVRAFDFEGESLTYSLSQHPTGMTIDSSGLIRWVPNSADPTQVGWVTVTVAVTEVPGYGATGSTTQQFKILSEGNLPPYMNQPADQTVSTGASYAYKLPAQDPNFDHLTFESDGNLPAGMQILDGGIVSWVPPQSAIRPQPYSITVRGHDDFGGFTPWRTYGLTVTADTEPPTVQISLSTTMLPIGNPDDQGGEGSIFPINAYVWARDNVGIANLTLTVDGQPVSLIPQGDHFTVRVDAPLNHIEHTYTFVATATDPSGNSASGTAQSLFVYETGAPTATINSPASPGQNAPAVITGPTDVIGSAIDPDNRLQSWQLTLEPSNEDQSSITLGSGTQNTTANAVLGHIDTTLLPNGNYTLHLKAVDLFGKTSTTELPLAITGQQKVGNFRFSETDYVIPVAGIPLALTRSYDSLNKDRSADFGYGWQMGLDFNLEEAPEERTLYPFDMTDPNYGYNRNGSISVRTGGGRDVFLTMPDGQRMRFSYEEQSTGIHGIAKVIFNAEPGANGAKLEVIGDSTLRETADDSRWYWQATGGITIGDFFYTADPSARYDIPGYILTMPDGTKFTFEKQEDPATANFGERMIDLNNEPTDGINSFVKHVYTGPAKLTRIVDSNGNQIDITDAGFTAVGKGAGIQFVRDSQNRISKVFDPSVSSTDPVLQYSYNGQGDLVGVTRLVNKASGGNPADFETTTYHYTESDGISTHQFQSVTSPSGKTPVINEYDNSGRLITSTDAFGRKISYGHNINARQEVVTDRMGQQTVYNYDARGNVLSMTNPTGQTTAYVYGDSANPNSPTSVTDSAGLTKTYTYDSQGAQTSESYTVNSAAITSTSGYIDVAGKHLLAFSVDPSGVRAENTYDTTGNLTQTIVKDANGVIQQKTTFDLYNVAGNLLSSTQYLKNALGTLVPYVINENDYDTNNRGYLVATRTKNASGTLLTQSTFTYDDRGNQLTATQYLVSGGVATAYDTTLNTYDLLGRLVSTTAHNGTAKAQTTQTFYTPDGQVDHTVDPRGIVTKNVYDSLGQQSGSISKYGTSEQTQTSTIYNANGSVSKSIDAHGNATQMFYDAAGRTVQTLYADGTVDQTFYDSAGRVSVTADRHAPGKLAHGTRMIYDAAGRTIRTERLSAAPITVSTANGISSSTLGTVGSILSTSATHYNAIGQVDSTTGTDNQTTTYHYDAMGRQDVVTDPLSHTMTTQFDSLGRSVKMFDTLNHETDTTYDELGRVTKTTFNDGTFTSTAYDSLGRKTSATDQLTRTTTYAYDVAGNLTDVFMPQVKDPQNGNALTTPHYQYAYNAFGDELTQTDAKGRVTSFHYDAFGRRDSRTMPTTEVERWTFDKFDRTVTHTDFKGQTTVNVYDDSALGGGRLAEEDRFTGAPTSTPDSKILYTYDELGRQQTVKQYAGSTLTQSMSYAYNLDGQLTQVASDEGVINYAYDPATQRHTRTYTPFNDTTYAYDELGRLKTVTATKLNGSAVNLLTTYGYDAVGNLQSVALPDDVTTTYTYDTLNRLTLETVTKGAATIKSFSYHLRADGQKDYTIETDGSGNTARVDWMYDALNRLTEEKYDAPGTANDFTDDYTLDLVGNRLAKAHDAGSNGSADETDSSTYNNRDQLITDTSSTQGTTTYTYDADGSQIDVQRVLGGSTVQHTKYRWDLYNRLIGLDTNADGTDDVAYTYDPVGHRVGKITPQGGEWYVIDDNNPTGYSQVLEQSPTKGGAPARSYVLGNDVIAQALNAAVQYLLYDGHGSTRALLDATGQIASGQIYAYDAFGNAIGFNAGAVATPLLYSGEYFDAEKGSYFLRGRPMYDTTTGTFRSEDDLGYGRNSDPRSLHMYLFVKADPTNLVDPNGHSFLGDTIVTVGITGLIGGITNGAISAAYAPRGHHLEAFLDGFASGYISSALTTLLLIYTPLPLPLANGVGSFVGNLALDYLRLELLGDPAKTHDDIWKNAIINGIAGVVWSSFVRFLPGGKDLYESLGRYRLDMGKAIGKGIPPTYPFHTAQQLQQALSLSLAEKELIQKQYEVFFIKMSALLSADAIGSNSLPAIWDWVNKTYRGVENWVMEMNETLGRRTAP